MINCTSWEAFLPTVDAGTVDMVLTDPPYTISRKTGFQSVVNGVERFAVSMEFGAWDQAAVDLEALSQALYRVLRPGGTAIVFYDLWKAGQLQTAMEAAGFKQTRLIIWEKTNPVPLNSKINYLTNAREIAVLGVKRSKPTFHGEYDNGVYSYPIPRVAKGIDRHPTMKPVGLMRDLILKHSEPDDLVLDCFLGSGTTALAALETGRRFTGCEIDPDWCTVARKRLDVAEPAFS